MQLIKSARKLTERLKSLRQSRKRIGFVPTMGCLHEGHLSLVRRARCENDIVVVSIFVNPTQFGPREDFKRYPRNLKRDKQLLKAEGADYLFVPSRSSIYPKGFRNFINPGPLARYLCGPKRPGHFRGVTTVVNRLFEIVKPHVAYFGEKDYQQARIIETMVHKLRLPVKIRTCPTVRESDGLAMSSRNRYLSKRERISARALYQSLLEARRVVRTGERKVGKIKRTVRDILTNHVSKIDYVEVVDLVKLVPLRRVRARTLVAVACYVGNTRLIDNLLVKI